MFGFFKKKSSAKDEGFISDLAIVASDFESGNSEIDHDLSEDIMSRALNIYLERNQEEAEYSASDFYLNSYTGIVAQGTIDGHLSPMESLRIFNETDSFLRGHPKYNTQMAVGVMKNWQLYLVQLGVIK